MRDRRALSFERTQHQLDFSEERARDPRGTRNQVFARADLGAAGESIAPSIVRDAAGKALLAKIGLPRRSAGCRRAERCANVVAAPEIVDIHRLSSSHI